MIVGEDRLRELARTRQGDLAEVPFATLLFALWSHERTCVVELGRGALTKSIVLEDGTPVECTSNLLHETLGKFLVSAGKMTEEQYQTVLAASARSGDALGTVMLRAKALSAMELFRSLQQNLAHKLLDVFSWETGTYRILGDVPDIESALRVNVPRLVLTGIERFVPHAHVQAGVAPLIGGALAVDPCAKVEVDGLRLNPKKARMAHRLKLRLRVDELMQEANLNPDEVMRFLYALGVMRVVRPASEVPEEVEEPPQHRAPAAEPEPEPKPAVAAVPETRACAEEVMSLYVDHRRLDDFDLLGLPETAEQPARADAWMVFAERFAPWTFTDPEGSKVRDQARDLFLAGARAFGQLSDADHRNSLINRRRNRASTPKPASHYNFEIRTDLLDATSQFEKGQALMQLGKYVEAEEMLAYSVDLSPGNAVYRAEFSYCRFLQNPEARMEVARQELEEVTRMDPSCGIGWFYRGEVCAAAGDFGPARDAYEHAVRLMRSDARARDALARLPH